MKKHTSISREEKGFTIVELLIATAVFAVIMLGATFVLVQVSKMYYKGIISSQTQEAARNIIDSVAGPLQFQGANVRESDPAAFPRAKCIGDQRYTYAINYKVNPNVAMDAESIRHGVWRDTLSSAATPCVPVDLKVDNPSQGRTDGSNGSDLLSANMRLKSFDVAPSALQTWAIEVGVLYGDRDLMLPDAVGSPAPPPERCKSGVAGSQWCALAEYKTKVIPRL